MLPLVSVASHARNKGKLAYPITVHARVAHDAENPLRYHGSSFDVYICGPIMLEIERAATAEPMGYFPTNQGFQTEITGGGGRRKKGKDKDGKCSIM